MISRDKTRLRNKHFTDTKRISVILNKQRIPVARYGRCGRECAVLRSLNLGQLATRLARGRFVARTDCSCDSFIEIPQAHIPVLVLNKDSIHIQYTQVQ